MMWEAANVLRSELQDSSNLPHENDARTSREGGAVSSRRSTETVEAAIARLTKAYSVAMACIGALQKTSDALVAEGNIPTDEQLEQVVQVANAARSTLESAILMDPLVVTHHARLVQETFQVYLEKTNIMTDDNDELQRQRSWAFVNDPRPTPPSVSSAAHQQSIRDMAYAALVNYADLLCSACACGTNHDGGSGLLSSHVVLPRLGVLIAAKDHHNGDKVSQFSCCWKGEKVEDTMRLALVALCDASELDGSDPTLWLKLAYAARQLGFNETPTRPFSERRYRRLERHALEQGLLALPPHLPPNRMVVKALEELEKEPIPDQCTPVLATPPEIVELVLEVPRYSWSRLGRMLIKAFREGTDYDQSPIGDSKRSTSVSFGSPRVALNLSPMLVLPSRLLGMICQYLENESIWKFEATCRALSVSIIAARVELERGAGKAIEKNVPSVPIEPVIPLLPPVDIPSVEPPPSQPQPPEGTTTSRRSGETQAACRTSKRLRSQQITSGKLAEKSSRRRSVEYCFLSATLSCASEDPEYIAILQQGLPPWPSQRDEEKITTSHVTSPRPQLTRSPSKERLYRQQMEARERVADASLSTFVERWSRKNSGPMDLMSKFLIHAALHVEDVFASDPGGVMALSSCFLDCLDVMSRRTGTHDSLAQFPFGSQSVPATTRQQRLEIFAVNLLAAELKLRRCERGALENMADHVDSLGLISFTISELMRAMPLLDELFSEANDAIHWIGMKARTFWLSAVYNFLISRGCPTVRLTRSTEQEGFRCIDETLKCLELPQSRPLRTVKTIHLESPSRVGAHWSALSRESLTSFRDDLQASSVVSLAREKFLTTLTTIDDKEGDQGTCSESIRDSLQSIGESLKSRYDLSKRDSDDKLVELLDDFISLHGPALSNHPLPAAANDFSSSITRWGDLWDLMNPNLTETPFLPATPAPSIISIFLASFSIQTSSQPLILRFLGRLVSVAYTYQKSFLPHRPAVHDTEPDHAGRDGDSDDFSDGDSLAYSSDDQSNAGQSPHRGSRGAQLSKPKLCIRLIQFFTEKMADICNNHLRDDERIAFAESSDCEATIRCCLLVCAEWYQANDHSLKESGDMLDIDMLSSIKMLVQALRLNLDSIWKTKIERLYLRGLSRVITAQRKSFSYTLRYRKGGRAARTAHQKRCKIRAEFVASVALEASSLLSKNLSLVDGRNLKPSELLAFTESDDSETKELTLFCDSLLWFWKYVMGFDFADDRRSSQTLGSRTDPRPGNSFDRPIVDQLRVPVAAALIGLCGAASCTRPPRTLPGTMTANSSETLLPDSNCLTEFFDTDASANEMSSDDDDDDGDKKSGTKNNELLRILCHAVYSVSLVLENVSEREAVASIHESERLLLPLVVARVLNHFADILLAKFGPHKGYNAERKNLFEVEYPFRARTIGRVLDDSLYKAYKCLHGFTLLSSQPITTNDESVAKKSTPESTVAAAQLYRCIERAYGSGRRSPPRAALECVALALPPLAETDKSKAFRNFLFSTNEPHFDANRIVALATEGSNWEAPFDSVSGFLTPSSACPTDDDVDELVVVQRGICHQLAQLPLPSTLTDNDSKSSDDDRTSSARTEEELSKKFNSILDDLCSGDCLDFDSWHRAAQCSLMKADFVADRLGLSKGFARNTNFRIPEHRLPSTSKTKLSQLMDDHEQEFKLQRIGWIPHLGDSLFVYIQKFWSSFSSLESCARDIGMELMGSNTHDTKTTFAIQVWEEIEWLKEKGDYVAWQQAWGSLFVAALRTIYFRCECLGLYSLFKQSMDLSDKSTRVSEVCESLGINLYSGLMGSQMYGYPMKSMTDYETRELAEAARICFRRAADSITASEEPGELEEGRFAWDLLFMIGKCYEKVAKTFRHEAFPSTITTDDAAKSIRRYEFYMAQALESYALSLQEARALEEEKDFILEQPGGSAHGSKEVFYRLHASRLKCLIVAVSQPEADISSAEDEALVLTEKNWYLDASKDSNEEKSVRDRVWDVFSDTVAALAQCKLDQPFFHRSVFRHAQALMWAPALNDPVSGRVEGSLGTVPISKGYRIRGLNSGTSVASSAQVIMASLFEKKRSQLCAVWVTNASVPSPFQVLNNSVRKYDSLRGKYISAYIDTLQLSQNVTQLEVLLQWALSCRRDLPSYYQASALARGLHPEHPHSRDNLLIKSRSLASNGFLQTVKRQANSAIANIILHELSSSSSSTRSNQDAKAAETRTRTAYACFLRLNCTVEELERSSAWRYGKVPEADAACQAYLALEGSDSDSEGDVGVSNDWSGGSRKSAVLRAALAKFRKMFPTITSNFYSKKASSKPRKPKSIDNDKLPSAPDRIHPAKRNKDQDGMLSRRMSFTVSVPDDMKAGDHFHTTVKLGEQFKKVTLTVPPGSPQTLKFSLDIPEAETTNNDEPSAKRMRPANSTDPPNSPS